ncbi:beta-galactosidase [Microbacterium nanhaiense]|uniref:Beta-galactosidase n=1 Tax=Microbacterium nanhaiense TaxID=1301026 RepID=A0ABQ2MVP1_9MICO|nr:beta-galactosidase [Microbacterium nanhaiense]GGO58760.1 beta-galactosidase [Microbacterium nanhaiense]
MHYGGDYNPEQWDESVWQDDVRLMREAGVTMVRVGVFAWAKIQPEEGVFEWEWLDRVIDLLHANGIQVSMATATASPPPWATTKYPEMLPQDENGSTIWHGSRQAFAPSSPVYRRLARELLTALVDRYAQHPAVGMWVANNEYGCHLNYDYSDNAAVAFRRWLQDKYGSLEALNAAWGTMFWSQRYTEWNQIVPMRKAPYSLNPGGLLDFKRFTSDTLLELFVMERDIIKASGATQPVTTNFMGFFPPADYWKWAPELDVICDDNYADPNDPTTFRGAAFTRDLMRSLKKDVPWILMEQAPNDVNWRPTNAPKAPGQMKALSIQAVARGADAINFFQWRQSRRGSERFHSGMVPHAGTNTRTWREITDLGETLKSLPDLGSSDSGARVAIAFDWEARWALDAPDHPGEIDYGALIPRWHAALHRQQILVDLVHPAENLSGYDLVIAPHLYLLGDEAAANLTGFVNDGGHLLLAAFADVVDEHDAFREGGFQVGLREVLGVTVEEFGALVPPAVAAGGTSAGDTTGSVLAAGGPGENHADVDLDGRTVRGEFFAEQLQILDPEVETIARFSSGRLTGEPALTSKRAGRGRAHYLATIPDDEGMRTVTAWAARAAGVDPVLEVPTEMIEVSRRGDVLTIINYDRVAHTVDVRGTVLGSGERVTSATLEPFAYVMLKETR